jgi:hypothetical protein
MSGILFLQLVALIFIFNFFMLLACVAAGFVYIKAMPRIMSGFSKMLEDEGDLDEHYGENPDVKFFTPPGS